MRCAKRSLLGQIMAKFKTGGLDSTDQNIATIVATQNANMKLCDILVKN
jgi:hypothetical protein